MGNRRICCSDELKEGIKGVLATNITCLINDKTCENETQLQKERRGGQHRSHIGCEKFYTCKTKA